ncbi:recombination regulator RecX [Robbsia sp. Bb-Pol-6]|uniref:Regulatory protein RecX n=1 Tax=Robbsia betulipollinis TaxID=2981849 RepID=A0ABT3ZQJ3_9BURK|nr:recombination regulator RecX [Robbsia betulipollinis]MCY0388687.1 recombination regulator RecX [Robbsia betulipollinis]
MRERTASEGVKARPRPGAESDSEPGSEAGSEAESLSYSRNTRRAWGGGGGRRVSPREERRADPSVAESGGAVPAGLPSAVAGADGAHTTTRSPRRSERQAARDAALGFKRSLRGRALGYLSRREHSRSELARKLAPFVEESDGEQAVERLLDALAREGWLSDNRFAESVVNRRAARFGAARIVGELKRHKLDGELVQELGATLRETEWTRIQDVWRKKFGSLATTPQERAKQARFLAARGFSRDLIMRILKVGNDALPEEE